MTLALEFRLNSSLIIHSELGGDDQKTPIALLRHLRSIETCRSAFYPSYEKPTLQCSCQRKALAASWDMRRERGRRKPSQGRIEERCQVWRKMETSSESLERQERSEKKGNKRLHVGLAAATVRPQQNCPCHTWITAFIKDTFPDLFPD